jgi:hypothetical protein
MRNKSERGSFTIEAILSLSIFMFAFVTIVSLATTYYLLATSSEGASYPIYIVGITLDGSETELSAFMDDMASQIKK